MEESWFTDESKFEILTDLLKTSIHGGTVRRRNIKGGKEIFEQGVQEGFITKDELIACTNTNCDGYHSIEHLPKVCSCGTKLLDWEVEGPEIVQYHVADYPTFLEDHLPSSIDSYQVHFKDCRQENFRVGDLHVSDDNWHIHISPYFEMNSGFHKFPGYNDILLSWNRVPILAQNAAGVVDDLQSFLVSEIGAVDWAGQHGDELLDSPTNPNPDDFGWNSGELTMLHRLDMDRCDEWSKSKYGYTYNNMFERFGTQFLNFIFPFEPTFLAAGKHKPDGYSIQKRRSYLIESKCWSSEFKISKERDKMVRYIADFIEYLENGKGLDFNLYGYIFIAHSFDLENLHSDIEDVQRRVETDLNLDVICITDQMMADTVDTLAKLYRMEPSSPYRIYDASQWYSDILDDLSEYTRDYGVSEDDFEEEILGPIQAAGKEPTELEEIIDRGFGPRSRWAKLS